MKRYFCLFSATVFMSYAFCSNELKTLEQNPNISLNPQDVPIFYDNNPLIGMKSLTVITSFPLEDAKLQMKLRQSIEKELKKIGDVVVLKDNDMRGFGAGNVLLIQMGNVIGWNGEEINVSRISLSIETPVTLDKTNVKTFPMVWSINTFLQGNITFSSENNLNEALQKLIRNFAQSYQYVNRSQEKRPVFYLYD